MRQRLLVGQRHGEHVLLCVLHALLDGRRHFLGLAHADADVAVAVAHDHQRGQTETATTLDDLGHAVDVNDALFELGSCGVLLLVASHRLNPF